MCILRTLKLPQPRALPSMAGHRKYSKIFMKSEVQIVGNSELTQDLLETINKVAPSDAPILIRGPTGSGKELVARALHSQSGRNRNGKFVAINCSAIPQDLLESELFGHEKGAFSGAVSAYPGRMRMANEGSLFLDEIGDMPSALQAKLLRALQEGVVTPVGSTVDVEIDIRIISATHKNLERMVTDGLFREDLFFRLNVIPLFIAPLCERPEEIIDLVEHFSSSFASDAPARLDDYSLSVLGEYSWPGNVRELQNFCRRLATMYPAQKITLNEVPRNLLPDGMAELLTDVDTPRSDEPITMIDDFGVQRVLDLTAIEEPTTFSKEDLNLKDQVESLERRLIERAVSESAGNIAEASRILGVKRTTLIEKMARLRIKKSSA